LVEAFWPGVNSAVASQGLRTTLSRIRLEELGAQMEALLEALRRSPQAQKRMQTKREILRRL
jgi:DNA-binding SARP family transcriptional activator